VRSQPPHEGLSEDAVGKDAGLTGVGSEYEGLGFRVTRNRNVEMGSRYRVKSGVSETRRIRFKRAAAKRSFSGLWLTPF